MKRLLLLAALLLSGCVSLKEHRMEILHAQMMGHIDCWERMDRMAARYDRELAAARESSGMGALGDEVAKETDKAVGPPPTYKKIIPSEWGTTPLRMKASPPSRPESYVEQFIRERKEAEQRLRK